VEGEKA